MKNFRLLAIGALALTIFTLAQAQSVEPKNTVITSDGPGEMVSTDEETTFTFKDHVVVTGTNVKMTCDFLQVVVLRGGDKTATIGKAEKFKSMLATGNVLMMLGDREVACGRAEVFPGEEKVVLTENPVMVDHDQNMRIAGSEIKLLRGQRQAFVKDPVITAPPIKDLGVDKELKPTEAPGNPNTKEPAATKESKPASAAPPTNPPATAAPKQP